MVVDTSALVAILFAESTAERLMEAILAAPRPIVSAASLVEVGIVAIARRGEASERELNSLLRQFRLQIIPVTADHAERALGAFRRFGKGRHPAGLNYGDCFSYALASITGEPLLCVGDDFARTDLQIASY
jgi:ribonuclease VapC